MRIQNTVFLLFKILTIIYSRKHIHWHRQLQDLHFIIFQHYQGYCTVTVYLTHLAYQERIIIKTGWDGCPWAFGRRRCKKTRNRKSHAWALFRSSFFHVMKYFNKSVINSHSPLLKENGFFVRYFIFFRKSRARDTEQDSVYLPWIFGTVVLFVLWIQIRIDLVVLDSVP